MSEHLGTWTAVLSFNADYLCDVMVRPIGSLRLTMNRKDGNLQLNFIEFTESVELVELYFLLIAIFKITKIVLINLGINSGKTRMNE